MIVAYVPDLLDRSKVAAVAPRARFANRPEELIALAGSVTPSERATPADRATLVVVDLSRPGALEAIAALPAGTRTVGFGSHVDRERLDAARQAGCSVVMTRRDFFARLNEVLGQDR